MTVKIVLDTMKFYAFHGVADQETRVGNYFVVDLWLTAPLQDAVKNDNLEDTINYASAYAIVKREMAIPSRLIEHAAGRILHSIKQHFPQITAIEVKLSKLTPPFGGDVHSAAVILSETYYSNN